MVIKSVGWEPPAHRPKGVPRVGTGVPRVGTGAHPTISKFLCAKSQPRTGLVASE